MGACTAVAMFVQFAFIAIMGACLVLSAMSFNDDSWIVLYSKGASKDQENSKQLGYLGLFGCSLETSDVVPDSAPAAKSAPAAQGAPGPQAAPGPQTAPAPTGAPDASPPPAKGAEGDGEVQVSLVDESESSDGCLSGGMPNQGILTSLFYAALGQQAVGLLIGFLACCCVPCMSYMFPILGLTLVLNEAGLIIMCLQAVTAADKVNAQYSASSGSTFTYTIIATALSGSSILVGIMGCASAIFDAPAEAPPSATEMAPPMPQYVPGQFVPGQFPPGQFPPGQFPPGQFPPGQFPPGAMVPSPGDPNAPPVDPNAPPVDPAAPPGDKPKKHKRKHKHKKKRKKSSPFGLW